MQRYANTDGDSSVRAFECGPDSITVQYSDGAFYLYNYGSCGQRHCEQMKTLAHTGSGLNSYIMRNVRTAYAKKWR